MPGMGYMVLVGAFLSVALLVRFVVARDVRRSSD